MSIADKDPWKDLVNENKESFNQRKPKDLWNSIEQQLDLNEPKAPKMVPLWTVYKIAAIFIIALTTGYFLMNKSNVSEANVVMEHTAEEELYPEEFIEAENYYATEIDNKMKELVDFVDDEILMDEITLLREEFDELKSEMGDQINDQRIVEAMIQNYRLRLNLLKEILREVKGQGEIRKSKKYETESI